MIINSQNRKLSNATSTQTKSHVESPLSNLEEIDRPVNFLIGILSFSGTFGQQNHYGVRHYIQLLRKLRAPSESMEPLPFFSKLLKHG